MLACLCSCPLHSLLLEVFVKLCLDAGVFLHNIGRKVATMVRIDESVDVEAFLAFHTMHHAALIQIAKTTQETHQSRCFSVHAEAWPSAQDDQ